jgi:hypothetical protein
MLRRAMSDTSWMLQSPKSPGGGANKQGFDYEDKENFEVRDFNSFAPPALKQDANRSVDR